MILLGEIDIGWFCEKKFSKNFRRGQYTFGVSGGRVQYVDAIRRPYVSRAIVPDGRGDDERSDDDQDDRLIKDREQGASAATPGRALDDFDDRAMDADVVRELVFHAVIIPQLQSERLKSF